MTLEHTRFHRIVSILCPLLSKWWLSGDVLPVSGCPDRPVGISDQTSDATAASSRTAKLEHDEFPPSRKIIVETGLGVPSAIGDVNSSQARARVALVAQ
ncbi:protein of unknown function [Agreia sp. COWG]|nr:protein of unknown function [Agreia sp. COWG]